MSVKGIIFDYGGTIDTPARHWSEIIWEGYKNSNINVDKSTYLQAYVYAERELAKVPHIQPADTFKQLLTKKIDIQILHLKELNALQSAESYANDRDIIANYCNSYVEQTIQSNIPVLEELSAKYPLVIVSNFYGNLNSVLQHYGVDKYFAAVVESAVVGVRKPSSQIFTLGVEALNLPANNVVVIGDSYSKDIKPALEAGCNAIWFKGESWQGKEDNIAYFPIIKSFNELPKVINIIK